MPSCRYLVHLLLLTLLTTTVMSSNVGGGKQLNKQQLQAEVDTLTFELGEFLWGLAENDNLGLYFGGQRAAAADPFKVWNGPYVAKVRTNRGLEEFYSQIMQHLPYYLHNFPDSATVIVNKAKTILSLYDKLGYEFLSVDCSHFYQRFMKEFTKTLYKRQARDMYQQYNLGYCNILSKQKGWSS